MPNLKKFGQSYLSFSKGYRDALGPVTSTVTLAVGAKYLTQKYKKCSMFCGNPDSSIPLSYKGIYKKLCSLKCKMDYYKAEMAYLSKQKGPESTMKYTQAKQNYLVTKKKLEKSIDAVRGKIKFADQTFRKTHAENLEKIIKKVENFKSY